MTHELGNFGSTRDESRDSQCHESRFTTTIGEADSFGGRNQTLDLLGPLDFEFVTGRKMSSSLHLPSHSPNDVGMAMSQQQCSVTDPIIDDRMAFDSRLS